MYTKQIIDSFPKSTLILNNYFDFVIRIKRIA